MRRLRAQITPSLVISIIALFVALSGTAMAAVIITSNSQVAQNTIAGHAPISGVHANLITGSVNATDLSAAYKASVKVHCPSGTLAAGGICIESALRAAATYPVALQTCAAAGRQLPDEGELALGFDHLGAPQNGQWAASHFYNANTAEAPVLGEDSSRNLILGGAGPSGSAQVEYRCITSPLN